MSFLASIQAHGGAVRVGDIAPDFTLPSQSGEPVRLHDCIDKRALVLFFYPKDYTPGCTAEACAFRDSYEVLKRAGAEVIGVSGDSVGLHRQFAERYRLPFTLLSDRSGAVRRLYGAQGMLGLVPGRVTYIIDRRGIVRHVFSTLFDGERHVAEALKILEMIGQEG